MYCKITYNATTLANVLTNIVNLLTDQVTNVSTLLDINAAASTLSTQYKPAGWAIHDQVDANNVVLKSLVFDSTARYKYIKLSASTAGFIVINVYDSWDQVNHVPGIVAVAASGNTTWSPSINITNGGVLYISAASSHAVIYSAVGSVVSGPYGIMERSRFSLWDTAERSICNFFHVNNADPGSYGTTGSIPVAAVPSLSGLTYNNTQPCYYYGDFGCSGQASVAYLLTNGTGSVYTMDANLNYIYQTYNLYCRDYVNSIFNTFGGSITELCDIRVAPFNVGNLEDTFTINAKDYVLMDRGWSTSFLYPAG